MTNARGPLWIVAMLGAAVLAMTACQTQDPPATTRKERVEEAFRRKAEAIKEKEGVPSAPTAHVFVGGGRTPDGTGVSLWAADPAASAGIRSRCWYLDIEVSGGGTSGVGGCGGGSEVVSLSGDGQAMVGSVGTWPARTVRLAQPGETREIPVTAGFLLVLGLSPGTSLTVTLLDAAGRTIGVLRDLAVPGSGTPTT